MLLCRSCVCVLLSALVIGCYANELKIQVYYNGSPQPNSMYLRGDNLGLNWNRGILMDVSPTNPDLWTVTLPYNASSIGQT